MLTASGACSAATPRRRSGSFSGFWVRFRCRGSGSLAPFVAPIDVCRDAEYEPHGGIPHRQSEKRKILSHRRLITSMYVPAIQVAMDPEKFHSTQGTVKLPVNTRSSNENTSQRIPHSRSASAPYSTQIFVAADFTPAEATSEVRDLRGCLLDVENCHG